MNGLNRGKLAVAVVTGIGRGAPGLDEAAGQLTHALRLEGMEVLETLKIVGNPECMVCGYGETCSMSAIPWIFGQDARITPDKFRRVEDQTTVWERAHKVGKEIQNRLRSERAM